MRALVYHGKKDIRCENVPDPRIEHDRDAIIRMNSCAICGSDLHLYNGFVPTMKAGDIMGHEFMGEVVEVGKENKKLNVGDRVVVPFTICCGECDQCRREDWAACEKSNRRKDLGDKFFGHDGRNGHKRGASFHSYTYSQRSLGRHAGHIAKPASRPTSAMTPTASPTSSSQAEKCCHIR